MHMALIELAQKAQIILEISAQVTYTIAQHGESFDSHSEGETAIFTRVYV